LGCGHDSLWRLNRRRGPHGHLLFAGPSDSGAGGGGRRAPGLFGRAAVPGQRVVVSAGVACFVRPPRGSQSLFKSSGLASRSMTFPAGIPGGNHRRGRAGATPVGGAYGAWRVGTGPPAQRRYRAYVATFRNIAIGSALEPQRLPRRRFLPGAPFDVTSAMKTRPRVRIAVRNFLPRSTRNDRLTTTETGGGRPGDEAAANPGSIRSRS
jgi:hypothetical protein